MLLSPIPSYHPTYDFHSHPPSNQLGQANVCLIANFLQYVPVYCVCGTYSKDMIKTTIVIELL